jgi:hypothetical protein
MTSKTKEVPSFTVTKYVWPCGGYRQGDVPHAIMSKYLSIHQARLIPSQCKFHFEGCRAPSESMPTNPDPQIIHVQIPFRDLVFLIPLKNSSEIARNHGMDLGSHATKALIQTSFLNHYCPMCLHSISMFSLVFPKTKSKQKTDHEHVRELTRLRVQHHRQKLNNQNIAHQISIPTIPQPTPIRPDPSAPLLYAGDPNKFPPEPLSPETTHRVITSACHNMTAQALEESGCAVCGQLTMRCQLLQLDSIHDNLSVLSVPGLSRKECLCESSPIREYEHVLDHMCTHVCNPCHSMLSKGKIPKHSLAKGLWIGPILPQLACLRFVEKLLIAHIRHSTCTIKIASGMRKMKANAIAFQSPTAKIYDALPPPRSDMEEVLAILFTGPCKPTQEDLARTPFLVRQNKVNSALEWLILNHKDYENIKISKTNLMDYPENMPPISIQFKQVATNKTPEGMSVFENEEEEGTELGECPFTVHGLTGEDLPTMSSGALKAHALQHLNSGKKVLAVGHSKDPENIWNNPQLYPQMFPWLFPYGLGGIGTIFGLSDNEHKWRLLMYHDKRFQVDPTFPFVAFSHQQIKTSTSNSFLLAKKTKFQDISQRIMQLDLNTLTNLLQKLSTEQYITPTTHAEKQCFQILSDLDHVTSTLKGSATSKKWMRNEIWALTAHIGAPFWYITLSPADIKHPICIYYASTNENFKPEIMPYDERVRLICNNPVAGSRFFHHMITIFIQCILGYGQQDTGLFGPINGYYGTVEQQGRLTLHLHMLLWLDGNLTPQIMRAKILDPNSDFQQKLVAWLESCQIGEFLTGTHSDIKEKTSIESTSPNYEDPTETLPEPPPSQCPLSCDSCADCHASKNWWSQYANTVDDLLLKSNVHSCHI